MLRLSRAQLREVDRIAIEEYGLPGIVLMENAARSAAYDIDFRFRMDGVEGTTAIIVCGGGNNAGDGYAVARLLVNDGWHATIVPLVPIENLHGDAAIMAHAARRMERIMIATGLDAVDGDPASTLVDAITGTGLSRPLEGALADAVRRMNASGRQIVALDVPSGLDCDTGEPLGEACIRASRTITFVAEKLGFANPRSREFTGEVVASDIGCPREIIDRVAAQS
jgi:hydroxyethylthiazole kinase-like uncharacterized protein yjeF